MNNEGYRNLQPKYTQSTWPRGSVG